MKKKGFTLIELLAVIVVLAIIALIATPIVMNTIKKSKKGAAERSADSYVKQVEVVATEERLNGNILEGEYNINSDGNLTKDGKIYIVEMNGDKPSSGKIIITNGTVDQASSNMTIGDYTVSYNPTKKTYEATEKNNGSSVTSTVVYRWSTDNINIGDTIDPSKYTIDSSTISKDYYLKHVLDKDNKVIESYACARYNNEEYCIQGGDASYYGYAEKESDYIGNMLVLKQLKDKGFNVNFDKDSSSCFETVTLNVISNGQALAYSDGACQVTPDGQSFCEG